MLPQEKKFSAVVILCQKKIFANLTKHSRLESCTIDAKNIFNKKYLLIGMYIGIGAKLAGAAGADAPVVFFGLVVS